MKKVLWILLLGAIAGGVGYWLMRGNSADQGSEKYDLVIACDSLGKKKEQCVASVKAFEAATGKKVKVVEAPTGSSNRLPWVQQQLASESEIDVYQIDAVWAGMLKNRLEPLNSYIAEEDIEAFHPILIQNNTVDGDLMALPWYVDLGLLIYRKDLLEKYNKPVPETWDELFETAAYIQEKERALGHDKMWGFVFSGKASESLTCNVNEWVGSTPNGAIVALDGRVLIDSTENQQLLERMAAQMGKIVPPGALNYAEEDSRGVFQSGNAVFMRHWPYVIALADAPESPIHGKVGVAVLPKDGEKGRHASTLGGWQLAVAKHSKNPALAAQMVAFLTSAKEQKERAIRGDYYPTRPGLYNDPEVQKALGGIQVMRASMDHCVPRPSSQTGTKYNQVSSTVWNAAHKVLLGQDSAKKALENANQQLQQLSEGPRKWS